jgi:hypothetical protein
VTVGKERAGDVAEPFEEAMAQKGLPGTWFTSEDQEALALTEAGQETLHGVFMAGSRVISGAIRRDRERPLGKTKV